jgi:hypothetical protein
MSKSTTTSQTSTETNSDDFDIDAYMESFNAPIITVAQPTDEGWYPAFITGFRLNYGVTDKKPKFPKGLADSFDGKYAYSMLSLNCQTSSFFARIAAKRDSDPFFSIENNSKKNPGCEGIDLNLVLNEKIGIDLHKSLGFLNFLGGLLAPTGMIEGNSKDGYTITPEFIQAFFGGVGAKREAILAAYEETGRYHEDDRKNHVSLIPAMLAEFQLEQLKQLLVDPTGESTVLKLVVLLGIRDHNSGDGRKENFAKSFRYWWEVEQSLQQDGNGTTFVIESKGKETVIDLLV